MRIAGAVGIVALGVMVAAAPASAGVIAWTDWTAATVGSAGSASGTLGGSVVVNYSGEVVGATQVSGGTDYWSPNTPYLSTTIANAPPAFDIIALAGGNGITNTLTFSRPLVNPVMAIVSQGAPNVAVTYTFNAPFNILSFGDGYWNLQTGCLVGNNCSTLTGSGTNVLTGVEAHGAIQFVGTYSSISWTAAPNEYWHGFTVGEPVPEPGTLLLLGSGISALALRRRRKS